MTGRCSAQTLTGWRCQRPADGPLCSRHVAIAARKAAEAEAEAAREAEYWERMFAPRPGQPWRTDPEWQAAKKDQLCEYPGENDNEMLVRSISAVYRVHEIQARYKLA